MESSPQSPPGWLHRFSPWLLVMGWTVMAVALVWPVLHHRYLPLVDFPEHVAQVALWMAHGRDPEVTRLYDVHLLSPYVGTYVVWRGLASLGLPVVDAGRVVLALAMVGIPTSFLVFLRTRQRPAYLALLAGPLVFNHSLAFGFVPFLVSVPLFFLSLAAFSRWLTGGRQRVAALVALCGMALLYTHALTAALWVACAGVLWLLTPGEGQRRMKALWPLLPAALVLAPWGMQAILHGGQQQDVRFGPGLLERLGRMGHYLVGGFTVQAELVASVVLLVVLASAVLGVMHARKNGLGRSLDRGALAAGVVALAAYFFLPSDLYVSWTNGRMSTFAVLLLLAAAPPVPLAAVQAALGTAALVITLATSAGIHTAFSSYSNTMGAADSLFSRVDKGRSITWPGKASPFVEPFVWQVMEHLPAYVVAENLGYTSTFAHIPHMVIQWKPGVAHPAPGGSLDVDSGQRLIFRPTGDIPDYLLCHTREAPVPAVPLADGSGVFRLLHRTGGLNLYVKEDVPRSPP